MTEYRSKRQDGSYESQSVDYTSIAIAIASYVAQHPNTNDDQVIKGDGHEIRFNPKECDCADDPDKAYAMLKATCAKQGGTWHNEAKIPKDVCILPLK